MDFENCVFCRRESKIDNFCLICKFNFDEINKKNDFNYESKLKYFKMHFIKTSNENIY